MSADEGRFRKELVSWMKTRPDEFETLHNKIVDAGMTLEAKTKRWREIDQAEDDVTDVC